MQASSLLSASWGLGSLRCLPLSPLSRAPTTHWAHSPLLSTALRLEGRQAYYIAELKFSFKSGPDLLKLGDTIQHSNCGLFISCTPYSIPRLQVGHADMVILSKLKGVSYHYLGWLTKYELRDSAGRAVLVRVARFARDPSTLECCWCCELALLASA